MLKIFPKYLDFENISKKCIRVPRPYRILVQTAKIEDTSFSFKTALSEANDKTNVMATTKWTYHEDWSFASNYFIFFGKLVSVLEPLKKS